MLWHIYSSVSDILLATLWWCMRADGSINRPKSVELGHSIGFSEWTTDGYAYLFWAALGLKLLTQFPAATRTRRQQITYLTYCYVITVVTHFPFILCVLAEVGWSGWIIAGGVLVTLVCYVHLHAVRADLPAAGARPVHGRPQRAGHHPALRGGVVSTS